MHARMYAPASASAMVGGQEAAPAGRSPPREALLLGRSLAGPAGLLARLSARWGRGRRGRRGRAAPLETPSTYLGNTNNQPRASGPAQACIPSHRADHVGRLQQRRRVTVPPVHCMMHLLGQVSKYRWSRDGNAQDSQEGKKRLANAGEALAVVVKTCMIFPSVPVRPLV